MDPYLIGVLRGGLPALATFLLGFILVQRLCRRPGLRRLNFALSLGVLAAGLTLLRYLVPRTAATFVPYLGVIVSFALAYLAFKVVEVLTLDVVAVRRGRPPFPGIVRDLLSALFAVITLVVLLRDDLGVDVTAVVATSAALSIVLGLALQGTLSDLFAGLALVIERPFEPGDWVRFGDRVGRIKEISWRAVKIQTLRQESYLIIPNSVAAKSEIVNMSQPTPLHGHSVEVGLVYGVFPTQVCRVLVDAALEVPQVRPEPRPFAVVRRFADFAVVYRLNYWIQDFAYADQIEGEVLAHIWYALRRNGLEIAYPTSNVYARPGLDVDAATRQAEAGRVAALLSRVDFLAALTTEEIDRLAHETRVAPYPAGVVVVRQGERGDSVFVVARGRVEVIAHPTNGGSDWPLAVIEPGSYFGEMSLLTGAPRSATVRTLEETELLVLTREALRPILLRDPAVAERLSRTVASRKALRGDAIDHAAEEPLAPAGDVSRLILDRIRRFFNLMSGDF